MTLHISTQLCLFERVVLVWAEESTETCRFKICLWGKRCWFSETAYGKVCSLVSQLFFFAGFSEFTTTLKRVEFSVISAAFSLSGRNGLPLETCQSKKL